MAYYTAQASADSASTSLRRRIADAFAGLQNILAANREYARLDAMSDAGLAKLGLSRQALPRHIFDRFLR